MQSFDDFLTAFFALYTQPAFATISNGSGDFLHYIQTSPQTGDEASTVDNAIVGPLLVLLGFQPPEQHYNQAKDLSRPDYAPALPGIGTCFLVEDKRTTLELDLNLSNPEGHLRQLRDYTRTRAVPLGILTNAKRLLLYRFPTDADPTPFVDLDVVQAVTEYKQAGIAGISAPARASLQTLWDIFRREVFEEPRRLEKELAVTEEVWLSQALLLGQQHGNDNTLVEALQGLVKTLADDAARTLREHLTRGEHYDQKSRLFSDTEPVTAAEKFAGLRAVLLQQRLKPLQSVLALPPTVATQIETILRDAEEKPAAFANPEALRRAVLSLVQITPPGGRGRRNSAELTPLTQDLDNYAETVFAHHHRQAALRQQYRAALQVRDDYRMWESLVRETMLGGYTDEERQEEFALQAAYVVFIRLLLIRVCEDKSIFPHRFLTDGGIIEWQKDIERYLRFANGNPYEPLLEMAYKNAQNIYAHFFTGRELFNWYTLDRDRLILTLHQLSRFNFADVDSDIVGTVYNTYVGRKEKKKRGQYYTPTIIVRYILDQVGYVPGPDIIGPQKRLIDPACGSGTFLVTAAKRLVEAYQNSTGTIEDPAQVLNEVRNSLFGFDLNPFACYLAEVNLLIQILPLVKATCDQTGQPPRLERFHIYNVDALATPNRSFYYAQSGSLMAEEQDEVNRIKSRATGTAYASGFRWVVANPPYGAELTPAYRDTLKEDYPEVWRGQPDTYVFFYELALRLLAKNGRLGFITPNTFLMGPHTIPLRRRLLTAGRITEVVDLPQGIWEDATVDCVLLFLQSENDADKRRMQTANIHLLGLRDSLDKLESRQWQETLAPTQSAWLPADLTSTEAHRYEMDIRRDALLDKIEEVCRVPRGNTTRVQRLGDVTESTQGIIPYITEAEGTANLYIKPQHLLPSSQPEWKPILNTDSYIGRYEVRWATDKLHIKYGSWLGRAREQRFFSGPKLFQVRVRNRSLKRRLVATYDDKGFYSTDKFTSIISDGSGQYNLKYLLALINSSLLNYWFSRNYDNAAINPVYLRPLPICPADAATQAEFVTLVDTILAKNAALNAFRDQGYVIAHTRNGEPRITVPYDLLLAQLQDEDSAFAVMTLFQAQYAGLLFIPPAVAPHTGSVPISRAFIPARYPVNVVLTHPKLYLSVPNDQTRRFLVGYLSRPQWKGQTYDSIKNTALVPADSDALDTFFAREASRIAEIRALLDEVGAIDRQIDDKVLDLYKITDPADRARILGDAPALADAADEADTNADSPTATPDAS